MNVLCKLLDLDDARNLFQFHPKYKKISLTHLSFADDLLISCKGSLDSIIGVKCILEKFYVWSNLKLNAAKSELFASGVNVNSLAAIQSLSRFKLYHLSVRYLGVHLVARNSLKRIVTLLLNKQLILAQSIIKHIEQLCARYLWKGSDSPATGVKIVPKPHFSWCTKRMLKTREESFMVLE
ncbi:uncharacterized protein LOC120205071 [Hibiscus syriacus]|uniref:uncharacterized protein LOC120205071 n=1 Tax=Hibiscus syriacus TaxID=106335 RepID=UPI001921A50D|nr:uncharacterized protein LOC120205071 [Hibiscus syriacus]